MSMKSRKRKAVTILAIMKTKKTKKKEIDAPQGIEAKIMAISDIPVEVNMLLYGRSGTGKTTIIGSMPKPLLILDIREKGTTSIRNSPDTFVLPITSWKEFEEAYWFLISGKRKFASIAIDTVTQLQDFALAEIRGSTEGLVSRKSWGEAASLLKTWIMSFRDLPMNVCFTAQDRKTGVSDEEDAGDDNSIMPEVGPYVMPSVAKILNAAVDIIGMTYIREEVKMTRPLKKGDKPKEKKITEYCLRIGPHPIFLTKFRSPVSDGDASNIPPVLVNAKFSDLLKLSLQDE